MDRVHKRRSNRLNELNPVCKPRDHRSKQSERREVKSYAIIAHITVGVKRSIQALPGPKIFLIQI